MVRRKWKFLYQGNCFWFNSSNTPHFSEAVEMVWDCDGENLAILDDKTSSVTLWDALTFKISQLNTGIK